MITIICKICGKSFSVFPNRVNSAKYCSRKCHYSDTESRKKAQKKYVTKKSVVCKFCGKQFMGHLSHHRKFCSRKCYGKNKRNVKLSQEHITNISKALKGKMPKNIKEIQKLNHTKEVIAKRSGKNHYAWKGDKVGYDALHVWVKKQLGTPKKCDVCGTIEDRRYEWANLSGKYKRETTDYKRMCVPCHRKFDDNGKKAWVVRRKQMAEKEHQTIGAVQ